MSRASSRGLRWGILVFVGVALSPPVGGRLRGQTTEESRPPVATESLRASPPEAFRLGIGGLWLTPVGDDRLTAAPDRPASGRLFVTNQTGSTLGLSLGVLRLAPDRIARSDASGNPLVERLALTAGMGGMRFNVTKGRVRAAPYLEVGAGRLTAQVDSGGYNIPGGYQPYFIAESGFMLGGGGGLGLDLILGPGITLSGSVGYSYFTSFDRIVDPIRGAFAGFGLSWTFRNTEWYWRSSGRDEHGPSIRVWSPQPSPSGVVEAGDNEVLLQVVASDLSGIDSMRIGTQIMRLSDAPREARSANPEEGSTKMGSAQLTLRDGANALEVVAFDGAGNRTALPIRVRGLPLDEAPPEILVLEPTDGAQLDQNRVDVTGLVFDAVDVTEVEVNGMRARLSPASSDERTRGDVPDSHIAYRFTVSVPLSDGRNVIRVVAADTMANLGSYERFVTGPIPVELRMGAGAPIIDIVEPAEWAASESRGIGVVRRSSMRVRGMVRYPLGISEIRVDGVPATLQLNQNGTGANFDGFVAMEDRARDVVVQATGADGSVSARTFSVRPIDRRSDGAPATALAGADRRQRWAIVIGVSEYLDERIRDLRFADEDAAAFYEFLRSPAAGLGGVPEENIMYLVDEAATERNIRTALQTFLRRSTEDDVIMVYIAAHGMPDPERPEDMYLLAHDTDLDNLPVTAINMSLVQEAVREAFSYNTIVFTDACHSGAVGSGTRGVDANRVNEIFLDRMTSSTGGIVMFTASETNQLSQEDTRWGGGHGAFTHYLLDGLRGAADENRDGIVELGEVMEYTRDRVRRDTSNAQVPTISNTQFDRFWPMAVVTDEPTPLSPAGEG